MSHVGRMTNFFKYELYNKTFIWHLTAVRTWTSSINFNLVITKMGISATYLIGLF